MTALQMKYEFEISYQLANLFSRSYNNKEISTLLTQAQKDIVLEIIESENNAFYNLVISKLKTTTVIDSFITNNIYPNSRSVVAPTAIKTLNSFVTIVLNSTSSYYNPNSSNILTNIPILPISEDYYDTNINNPDKAPYEKLVWRLRHGLYQILIGTDKYSFSEYKEMNVTFPSPIIIADAAYNSSDGAIDGVAWSSRTTTSLDSSLDQGIHKMIVDRAVMLATKISGNTERLQNELQLNKT